MRKWEEKLKLGQSEISATDTKKLTGLGLWTFIVLCMFPMSPTQTYVGVSQESGGNAIPSYFVAAIAILFTGFCYMFMSGAFRGSGGAYTYVQQGINKNLGFIAGAIILLDYFFIGALLPKFAAGWAEPLLPGWMEPWMFIVILMVFVTAVVGAGITVSKWVNYAFLAGQIVSILALGVYTAIFAFVHKEGLAGFDWRMLYNKDTLTLAALSAGSSIAVLGFIGADSGATLSDQVKGGKRTTGLMIVLGILFICMVQMVQALMLNTAHPDYMSLHPDQGYFQVVKEVGGDTFYKFVTWGCVLFVGVANAIPPLTALGSVIKTMARDNTLPASKFFARVNPRTGSPLNAILFSSGVSMTLSLTISLDTQGRMVNFGAMVTYILVAAAVFWFFKVVKKETGLGSIAKYVLVPLMAIVVILFIMAGFDKITYQVGFSWIGLVVVYTAIFHKRFNIDPANAEE